MAWICFLELAESASLSNLGLDQSPTVSKIDTLKPYSCPECRVVNWTEPQSGTTFGPCVPTCCLVSISSSADFRAKTYPSQEKEQELTETAPDFTSNCSGSSTNANRRTCFWKTSPLSGQEGSTKWPKPLPIEGMILGGRLYQPQKSERRTSEKDGGCWLPTPRATDYKDCGPVGSKSHKHRLLRGYLDARVKTADTPNGKLNPMWVEWLMGYDLGWTELSAWATQWYLLKRGKRS